MSLQVDDERRRGRSRSPGGRGRDRSRGREPAATVMDATPYPDDRDDGRGGPRIYDYSAHEDPYSTSSYHQPVQRSPRSSVEDVALGAYRGSRDKVEVDDRANREPRGTDPDKFAFLPQKYAGSAGKAGEGSSRKNRVDDDLAYGAVPGDKPDSSIGSFSYSQPRQWEYAKAEQTTNQSSSRRGSDRNRERDRDGDSGRLVADPRASGQGRGRSPSPGPQVRKYYHDSHHPRDPRDLREGYGDDPRSSTTVVTAEPSSTSSRRLRRESSPQPPTARMSSLSVSTPHHSAHMSLSAGAPASPLLESYHGTYQSMSPMPSPLLLASHGPGADPNVLDVSPIGSDDERYGGGAGGTGGGGGDDKKKRRARFADPVGDAERLAKSLKGSGPPDTEPLVEVLPGMTHEQIMTLRAEYKHLVKTGPDRKGVNIAKHIRSRLKDEDPSLMKACYAVALGQWESEAYWANFWYQGDKTRRELLIESLMGRTNDEIHAIKAGFSDKKYDNSLRTCMRTELKEDKFKKAVMMVLDEQRMEERDQRGRWLPIDRMLVEDDVRALHRAVRAEKGGESAMIAIVIMRSDNHLREVLKQYNAQHRSNFARDALKKSGNLVGELLAHILNGVINKPVRDALLLHHALTASKRDELRRELLTSRLVRFHWDRHHLAAIKAAYRDRYGKDLQEAVREAAGNSDWGRFCKELCITRMPDDVRRVERVEKMERR